VKHYAKSVVLMLLWVTVFLTIVTCLLNAFGVLTPPRRELQSVDWIIIALGVLKAGELFHELLSVTFETSQHAIDRP